MADGFLGRWAKRKEAVRKGEEVAAEPVAETPVVRVPPPQPPVVAVANEDEPKGEVEPVAEALPTLDDVDALTPASDFSRFVRPGVSPQVKNAAMKKLFADPHFNVMDRLDIYIDDYGKADPIPPEMLRQLASAKFLNLFDDDKETEGEGEGERDGEEAGKAPTGREVADVPPAESVAQLGTAEHIPPAVPLAETHADPDLRLQQDDAPGPEGPGERTR